MKCWLINKHNLKDVIIKKIFAKNLNQTFVVFLSLFLLASCKTALTSLSVAKLACFNLVSNIEPKYLLNLGVVIYLALSGILFSTFPIFVLRTVVFNKPLVSGILFSTLPNFILRAVVVTKPLTSGILFSTSTIFYPNFLSVFVLISLN